MQLLPDLSEPEAPVVIEAGSSLEFLQAVYRDPGQPVTRRMRAAIAALPFEHPKLAVVASIRPDSGFAARLEEAIVRSQQAKVIGGEAKVVLETVGGG